MEGQRILSTLLPTRNVMAATTTTPAQSSITSTPRRTTTYGLADRGDVYFKAAERLSDHYSVIAAYHRFRLRSQHWRESVNDYYRIIVTHRSLVLSCDFGPLSLIDDTVPE